MSIGKQDSRTRDMIGGDLSSADHAAAPVGIVCNTNCTLTEMSPRRSLKDVAVINFRNQVCGRRIFTGCDFRNNIGPVRLQHPCADHRIGKRSPVRLRASVVANRVVIRTLEYFGGTHLSERPLLGFFKLRSGIHRQIEIIPCHLMSHTAPVNVLEISPSKGR